MATWWEELTHWKRPWCWERLKAGGDRNDRGWDGWIVSSTQWTWVWVNPGSWRWTGRPGVLQSVGSPRVGHDWGTELNWMTHLKALFMCWGHWKICPYEILLAVEKAKKRQQKSLKNLCRYCWKGNTIGTRGSLGNSLGRGRLGANPGNIEAETILSEAVEVSNHRRKGTSGREDLTCQ